MTGIFSGTVWLDLVLLGIGLLIGLRLGRRAMHSAPKHWRTADRARLHWS